MAYEAKADSEDYGKPGPYWHKQLEEAETYWREFHTQGDKIIKRYRDERRFTDQKRRRFNILWSNVQVLKPALYGRQARPDVSRRHDDRDPIGRVASMMLERCIVYEIEHKPDFDQAMNGIVDDRLLPGMGIAWIRYEPRIVNVNDAMGEQHEELAESGTQITDDQENESDVAERVVGAHSPCDYVHWKDYLCSPSRTEEEVWWRSRYVYMTREEGMERFGEVFRMVPIEYDATQVAKDGKASKDVSDKKAKVAEIWNKRTGKVCWVAKGYPHALDERDDPLGLEGFFPCTKIAATTTTDSVIPVPDYCEYQDQAEELDNLTQRIHVLTKAVKANGVFNAEFKAIKRLLNEGVDNVMEPVDAWAAFAEKGGLRGAMDLMNTDPIIKALEQMYLARDAAKQTIYEVTGMSDVIRGATNPNETLGAQQLKASFGSIRLKAAQGDVARAATELFRMKAQLICKFYPPEVIRDMSGIAQTLDGQNEEIVMRAIELLKNSQLRDWRINVESDSLAQLDEMADKQARVEAVTTIGTFMKNAFPVVAQAPQLLPFVSETVQFLMRGFRVSRTLESSVEESMQALMKAAEQAAANPKPDPKVQAEQVKAQTEQAKAQAEIQKAQIGVQVEQQKGQIAIQREQAEFAIDQQRAAAEHEQDMTKLAIEGERMRMQEQHARAMPAPRTKQ